MGRTIAETGARAPHGSPADLDGLNILVTGAGSGIGSGIARVLAAAGAVVFINDHSAPAAEAMVAELTGAGLRAHPAVGDITDPETVRALAAGIEASAGGVDVLVNNAGITGVQRLSDLDLATWERVLAVNLTAPFLLAAALLPGMAARGGGRIINIASIAGIRVSVLGGAAYTASKSGIIGLTRHLAAEYAAHGVTVNAVLPGVTLTPLVEGATDARARERISASVPLGRMGTPRDIGALVAFLASEGASYITGAAIPVDGGMTVLPGDYTEYRTTKGED